jgi:hypothetical protein
MGDKKIEEKDLDRKTEPGLLTLIDITVSTFVQDQIQFVMSEESIYRLELSLIVFTEYDINVAVSVRFECSR